MKPYLANDVKLKNRQTVYKIIQRRGVISRTDISNELDISSPTVMKIMNYMQSKGIVNAISSTDQETTVGRKPQLYRFNAALWYAVGIILEGEYLRIGITDMAGEIVSHTTLKCDSPFDSGITDVFIDSILQILESTNIPITKVCGVGIGIPGIYDPTGNCILLAPLIGVNQKTNVDFLINGIKERFDLPVVIGNDVNMEVLGEYNSLSHTRGDMLYISLGTGVGAGIILDGKLRLGNTFNSGEIGYMAFLDDYVAENDNPGWLESRINLSGLKSRFDFDIYSEYDEKTLQVISEYVAIPVALCINNITTVLDLKDIVIGGVLTERLGDRLLSLIREKVRRLSIFSVTIHQKSTVDAGIIGATSMIIDQKVKSMLDED